MVCCARAGYPAPPLGSEVNVDSGLSGECLRTGQPAMCEDAATDPRVDNKLCLAIGIGSFVATPILSDSHAIGLLEVFSPQVCKFSTAEADILEHLAKLVFEVDPARKQRTMLEYRKRTRTIAKRPKRRNGADLIAESVELPRSAESAAPAMPEFPAIRKRRHRSNHSKSKFRCLRPYRPILCRLLP